MELQNLKRIRAHLKARFPVFFLKLEIVFIGCSSDTCGTADSHYPGVNPSDDR